MTQDDAKAYLDWLNVPRETHALLQCYADLLIDANDHQNLIGRSTVPSIWTRHIVDSAQILAHAPVTSRNWLDVGSGAGLPGLVLSILTNDRHALVEPRRLRADFLKRAVRELGVSDRVTVHTETIESMVAETYGVITARALKALTQTLAMTFRFARPGTVWLLHKGKTAAAEIDVARHDWQGEFELLPSVTDASAAIVRVRNLQPRLP